MTQPYFSDEQVTLYAGDCLEVLATLADNSIDACATDPPYNLSFMAKPWDAYEGREDSGFAYWLTGLIDGEGCFTIKSHTRGTHAPSFAIKLRADDRAVVEHAHKTLGVGTIRREFRDGANNMVTWTIGDKNGCQRLVDLLDKYPLRAKKRVDYWAWRDAVCEWVGRGRGNRWHGSVDNARMSALRDRLMTGRAYTEVAWSGNEFQDWCRIWATECLRVLKPGGHMLAFGGTRTWHRLAAAIEDAGFEIRDSIAWLYGSGFPKSLDVSKAIDKSKTLGDSTIVLRGTRWIADRCRAFGLTKRDLDNAAGTSDMGGWWASELPQRCALPTSEQWTKIAPLIGDPPDWLAPYILPQNMPGEAWEQREVIGARTDRRGDGTVVGLGHSGELRAGIGVSDAAKQWAGWGTALKPAFEPIVVARKPLAGTVAANVLAYGTGALNIDGCRVAAGQDYRDKCASVVGLDSNRNGSAYGEWTGIRQDSASPAGRWPTNVVLDEQAAEALDIQSGQQRSGIAVQRHGGGQRIFNQGDGLTRDDTGYGDTGGASRYFPVFKYTPKAASSERPSADGQSHPTVKPLDLMRWLIRLVTPPGGVVLDPFAGSGTTGEAAIHEHKRAILIEREPGYLPLIKARLHKPMQVGFDFEEPA